MYKLRIKLQESLTVKQIPWKLYMYTCMYRKKLFITLSLITYFKIIEVGDIVLFPLITNFFYNNYLCIYFKSNKYIYT